MPKQIQQVTVLTSKRSILSLSVAAAISLLATTDVYACLSYSNNVILYGSIDCMVWSGGNFMITNTGTLNSTNTAALSAIGTASTLTNYGLLNSTNAAAVENTSSALVVLNNSQILSHTTAVLNNGTIASLSNNTAGSISGTTIGIQNNSVITELTNSGLIFGSNGINNAGELTTLSNSTTGNITGTTVGILNTDNIGRLTNSGAISGTAYGVQTDNGSVISTLENTSSGTITGGTGILAGNLTPSGSINVYTLTNAGQISGTTNVGVGTSSNASIGTLRNSGLITGHQAGVGNAGAIHALINSGTISSSNGYALYNASSGTIGQILNSGLIAGTIYNGSTRDLTINGGSGSLFGTLTGSSGNIDRDSIGNLYSTNANLQFNSGNLLINDDIIVNNGAVANNGATVQVNNILNVTGNYHQAAAATLLIGVGDTAVSNGVAADTGYGRLVVSGASTIESGSSVALKALNTYGFADGQRYVVLQSANAGTNYNDATLQYSAAGFAGNVTGATLVEGNSSHLVLTLNSANTEPPGGGTTPPGGGTTPPGGGTTPPGGGTTPPDDNTGGPAPVNYASRPNAAAALNGLSQYPGINAELLNVYNASLALGSVDEANRVGAQLSPAWGLAVANQVSMNAANVPSTVIDARLDGFFAPGNSGISTGEGGSEAALWGQVLGGKSTQDQRNDISGYSADYHGLLLGSDVALNAAWRVGAAFSYIDTSADGRHDNAGSSLKLKSYSLTPYASYTAEDWYMRLTAGLTQHQYDTRRLISFNGVNGQARGNHEGWQTMLSGQVGYPILLSEQTVLTPIAGLNYMRLKQDGYTEKGGAGAALKVDSTKGYSLTSDLGAKLEHSIVTSYGNIEPSAQLTWRHEHRDARLRTDAAFALDTSASTGFTSVGPAPARDTGILALAATWRQDDNLSLSARYSVSSATGYTGQAAELSVRYAF